MGYRLRIQTKPDKDTIRTRYYWFENWKLMKKTITSSPGCLSTVTGSVLPIRYYIHRLIRETDEIKGK